MPTPRKRAAKKAVKKQAPPVESPQEEEWNYHWPKEIVEKHKQRQEVIKQAAVLRVEQKQQRMINNGVPSEKRPI
jgi:hypothetical protein